MISQHHSSPDFIHPDSLRGINLFTRNESSLLPHGHRLTLPIDARIPEILRTIQDNRVCIVVAPTGAGKSTRVPAALLEQGYHVIATQPRRIAARALARRVAAERGEELGHTVGYRTAHESADSIFTRLLYCTDGLALVKELRSDHRSQNRRLIIDEVHEFNLNIETLLAWAKHELD